MKLKLDLHTHCHEATFLRPLTVEIVGRIVASLKAQGLDGIAITDHEDPQYGFKVKEIADQYFPGVLIIPGQEISVRYEHVVELYLPEDRCLRFWAHPRFVDGLVEEFIEKEVPHLQGIEVKNGGVYVDMERVTALGLRHNLLLLENSDAHSLRDIGCLHNEVEMEELYRRSFPRNGRLP